MGWSLGYDEQWKRDIGYGVPATCDHPGCNEKIDRGISHLCGFGGDGGDEGCGLHFCGEHLAMRFVDPDVDEDEPCRGQLCEACAAEQPSYTPKPDHPEWINWKLTDESWEEWRQHNPQAVEAMRAALEGKAP